MDKDYEKEEQEIHDALKQPFDYGSEEYLNLIEKIKENRARYKAEQETKRILKYKFFEGVYER